MKKLLFILLLLPALSVFNASAQDADSLYGEAMERYNNRDYPAAATAFDKLRELLGDRMNVNAFYNGACIYAMNGESGKATGILAYLVKERLYSDLDRVLANPDFQALRGEARWSEVLDGLKENLKTLPERTALKVEDELAKAKTILLEDDGRLWGDQIWNDNILVLCDNYLVYSVKPFEGSAEVRPGLYRTQFPEGSLFYTNCVQEYDGESYAVVRYSSLNDYSSTVIHELFHVLQYTYRKFYGEQIDYLDNYDARVLLRLEYHALKHCLEAIDEGRDEQVPVFLRDAVMFRRARKEAYPEWGERELELETLEGMANYTGYKLSTYPNKFRQAVREINSWENTNTYIRSFSYATGPAYGLIYDHLGIDWREPPGTLCDFHKIYADNFPAGQFSDDDRQAAYARNQYDTIYTEETERMEKNLRLTERFMATLVEGPTLSVEITDYQNYGQTYDMNATFVLEGQGIVFTALLEGTDESGGKNFGQFSHYPEKSPDGISGILRTKSEDGVYTFVFPAPLSVEGNIITGETYEIRLNEGWTVEKTGERGDYRIVKD